MKTSGSETKVDKKPQPTTDTTLKKGAKRKIASQLTGEPAGSGKRTTDEKPSGPKNRCSELSQEPVSATSGPGAICPAPRDQDPETQTQAQRPGPRDPDPETRTQTQRLFLEEALAHLRRNDPSMGPLIDRHGPPACFTGPTGSDPFHALCRTIVYQQLAGKAAATIFGRFTDLYVRTIQTTESDTNIDTDVTLTPKPLLSLTIEELRSVGLSNQKASYIQNVARYFEDGQVTAASIAQMNDETLVKELTSIKGIGIWSVHMFMMFTLKRPDVLPVGDLGVRKGFVKYFGLKAKPSPKEMETLARSRQWAPFRSVATCYMWRAADTQDTMMD